MDNEPDTFIPLGEALPAWLQDVQRKMRERQKEAENKLRAA